MTARILFSLVLSLTSISAFAGPEDSGLSSPFTLRLVVQSKIKGQSVAAATAFDSQGGYADGFLVGVVCSWSYFSQEYSADLVFPTPSGDLTLDNYDSTSMSRAPRSAFRRLSANDSQTVCRAGAATFDFHVATDSVRLANVGSVKAFSLKKNSY